MSLLTATLEETETRLLLRGCTQRWLLSIRIDHHGVRCLTKHIKLSHLVLLKCLEVTLRFLSSKGLGLLLRRFDILEI